MVRVHLLDEANVIDDVAYRRFDVAVGEPVVGVEISDGVQGHGPYGQASTQLDEPVDVPGVEPPLPRPEVVLLPHPNSVPAL